jgi:hypothetical protein
MKIDPKIDNPPHEKEESFLLFSSYKIGFYGI